MESAKESCNNSPAEADSSENGRCQSQCKKKIERKGRLSRLPLSLSRLVELIFVILTSRRAGESGGACHFLFLRLFIPYKSVPPTCDSLFFFFPAAPQVSVDKGDQKKRSRALACRGTRRGLTCFLHKTLRRMKEREKTEACDVAHGASRG